MTVWSETAVTRANRIDSCALDHLPACGKCGDLSGAGSERCEGCGAKLLLGVARARPTLAQLAEAAAATPEPAKSDLVGYWLAHFTADELSEFVAGIA